MPKWDRRYEEILTLPELWVVDALREHEDGNDIAAVLLGDLVRLGEARAKHPRVGENVYHALGALSAEHGEVCQELEKHREGWEARMDEELKDVRVVALRMSLREYEHGHGEDA
jgi:hypothetical protein